MSRRHLEGLLSLGSNVEPRRHVPYAVEWLRRRHDVVAVSPSYRCPPVGGDTPQPDFANLAVRIRTDLPPRALKEVCRRLEDACGRERSEDRYAPRTMDVDPVLLDDVVMDLGAWQLPDPGLATAAFVLVPCADVWPDAVHPLLGKALRELRDALPREACERLKVWELGA